MWTLSGPQGVHKELGILLGMRLEGLGQRQCCGSHHEAGAQLCSPTLALPPGLSSPVSAAPSLKKRIFNYSWVF